MQMGLAFVGLLLVGAMAMLMYELFNTIETALQAGLTGDRRENRQGKATKQSHVRVMLGARISARSYLPYKRKRVNFPVLQDFLRFTLCLILCLTLLQQQPPYPAGPL